MSGRDRKRKTVISRPDVINTVQSHSLQGEENLMVSSLTRNKTESSHYQNDQAIPRRRFPANVYPDVIQMRGVRQHPQHATEVDTVVPLCHEEEKEEEEEEEDDARFFRPSNTAVPWAQHHRMFSDALIVETAQNPMTNLLPEGQPMLIAPESVPTADSDESANIETRRPVMSSIPYFRPGRPESKLASPSEPQSQGFALKVDSPKSLSKQYSIPQNTSVLTSPLSPPSTGERPILFSIPLSGHRLSPTDKISQSPISELKNKTITGRKPHLEAPMSPPSHGLQTSQYYSGSRPLVSPLSLPYVQSPMSRLLYAIPVFGPGPSPTDIYSPSPPMQTVTMTEPQSPLPANVPYTDILPFLNPTQSDAFKKPSEYSLNMNASPSAFQYVSKENGKGDRLQNFDRSPTSPYSPSQPPLSVFSLSRSTSTGSSQDPISPSSSHSHNSERTVLLPNDPIMPPKKNLSKFSFVDLLNDQQTFAAQESTLNNSTCRVMPSSRMVSPGHGPMSPQCPVFPAWEANNNTIPSPGLGVRQIQSQFASLNAASAIPQSEKVFEFYESPRHHGNESKDESKARKFKFKGGKFVGTETIYQCTICYKEFDLNVSLRNHERSHRTDKDHHCRFCDDVFHFKAHLRSHERNHAKQLRICRYCGVTLECDYDLVQHERKHRENKDEMLSIYAKSNKKRKKKKKNAEGNDPPSNHDKNNQES